jgi:hypothetical protein
MVSFWPSTAEIHVVLLVAVKERSAWVIGRELGFGLLIGLLIG